MAQETVGTAVLELKIDGSTFDSGIDRREQAARDLVASFDRAAKAIQTDLSQSAQVAEQFSKEITAAFTSVDLGSRTLAANIQKVIGADAIERANSYAKAVTAIGGVSKLTASEQQSLVQSTQAALQKYQALGIAAPKSLTDVASAAKTAIAATTALERETAAVQQQMERFSGKAVVQEANAMAAAIQKIGGVSKLTAADQAAVNRTVQEALAHYKALGQQAPAELDKIERETRQVEKSTSALSGVLSTAFGTFAGFLSAQAVMSGVSTAFKATIGTAIEMNSTLEKTTLQFTTLMGNADEARAHVEDLFEFAKKTPFETGPIIEASKMMRTFGGAALDTSKNLTIIGNAAAATGAPINELGFWVGRLYSNLKGGQPFGEAAMRLQELAVLSPQARQEMEALQKAGKSADDVFTVFQASLGRFNGAMELQASTWEGVVSTFTDSVSILTAKALKPLFEGLRDSIHMVDDAMSSATFESSAEEIAKSISRAFGDDPQAMARGMATILLDIADAAVTTADVIHRTWAGLQVALSLVGNSLTGILAGISEANARVVETLAAVPVIGARYKQAAADARETANFIDAMARSYEEQTREAFEAVKGNDAWTKTLDAARASVVAMRTELAKATVEKRDFSRVGDLFTGGLTPKAPAPTFVNQPGPVKFNIPDSKALTPFADALRDANAQLARLKADAPDTFRDIVAAIKSGNASSEEMVKDYHLSALAVKTLQDQINGSGPGMKAAATEAKRLSDATRDIGAAAIELTDAQKATALANEALSISHEKTARVLHVNADAIDQYISGVKNAQAVDAQWTTIRADMAKGVDAVYEHWMAAERKQAEASAASLVKQVTDHEKYQSRVNEIGLAGVQLQLKHIDDARTAEIRSMGLRTDANASFYDENRRLIDEYYAHQQRLALGTADTIVERMHQQGVAMASELRQQAANFKRDYDQMRDSGLYTTEQLAEQWRRYGEAARKAFGDTRAAWADFGRDLSQLGGELSRFGGRFAEIAGQVVGGAGSMIGATQKLQKQFAEAGTGAAAMASTTVASIMWVIQTYQAMVAVAEKLIDQLPGSVAKPAIDQRGGRTGITQAAATAGKPSLGTAVLEASSLTSFQRALRNFDQAIAENDARLQRYGITWRDLGESVRKANIEGMTRQLIADGRAFFMMGLNVDQQTKAMSKGLNQLVIDAVTTGQKIPVALQPMLNTLIRSGQLSEEAAAALLGIQKKAVPAFKDIEAAAARYGIEIGRLGKAVQQIKIDDLAQQIIADWELLQDAGGDTNTVLVGMQKSVQDVVREALTAGLKIPAAMKPIIDAMIAAGLLTDQFGNKLTDVGAIEFEKPLTEAISDLIMKLDELIDKMSGVGGAADNMGRRIGDAVAIGQAVPRGTAGTGGETGTGTPPPTPTPTPTPTPQPTPAPTPPPSGGARPRGDSFQSTAGKVITFPDGSTRVLGDATTANPARRYVDGGVVAPEYLAAGRSDIWNPPPLDELISSTVRSWRQIAKDESPFQPRGTDTIPAMLTPRESVLDVDATKRLTPSGVDDMNAGRPLDPALLRNLFDPSAITFKPEVFVAPTFKVPAPQISTLGPSATSFGRTTTTTTAPKASPPANYGPFVIQIPPGELYRAMRDGAPIVVEAINGNHMGSKTQLSGRGRPLGGF